MESIEAEVDRIDGRVAASCGSVTLALEQKLCLRVGRGWADPSRVTIVSVTFYADTEARPGTPRGSWKRDAPGLLPDGVEVSPAEARGVQIERVASGSRECDYWFSVTMSVAREGGADRYESEPERVRRSAAVALTPHTDGGSTDPHRAATPSSRRSR